MAEAGDSARAERIREARDRGGAYLLAHQAADGGFPGNDPKLDDYYKAIRALEVCGHTAAASRLCSWIRQNGISADGDFGPRGETVGGYAYAYFNAWVIVGAHRLGHFDLSQRGMDFLARFWDADSRGFFSSATERDGDTPQDLMVTCMCGLAALYTGRLEIATAVSSWLRMVMAAQPDVPRRLYTVYSRKHGLHTDPGLEDDPRYVLHTAATRDEYIFNPGIAGAFLTRLWQATAEDQWLSLAREFMRCAEVASDFLLRTVRAGKVAWAASLLHAATGEDSYRQLAVRIGENLLELQAPEGYWSGGPDGSPSYDSTAERVAWMDEIYAVAGAEGAAPA